MRLFCVPYAGSGASCYHAWARALSADGIEVRSVQLPGRENRLRETPLTAMPDVVAAVTDRIEPFLDRPYAIFGHSMGALVAYEVARELQRRGRRSPEFVIASGAAAPQIPREDEPLHALPDDELVKQVSERYQGIPKQVLEHKELLDLILPALRGDLSVIENYQFNETPRLACPVSAFSGDGDKHVTPEKLARWQEVAGGAFEHRMFAGDHFYLHDHRDALIDIVRQKAAR